MLKILNKRKSFLFILLTLFILSCLSVYFIYFLYFKHDRNSVLIHPISTQKITLAINTSDQIRKPKAGWHTSVIGTSDSPTIDGGIINTTDGLPIYQSEPVKNVKTTYIKNTGPTVNQIPFSDEWATTDKIKVVLERAVQSGKLGYVLKESDKKNLPASVALLPLVESGYRDQALSQKGAVGSWQLMPETARENGIDPKTRTDFVPSTQAALNLLNNLHQQFGSWELAFAAYNAGSTRVKKALQENPKASSITELNLPHETKDYVNRLMTVSQIITTSE